MITGTQKDALHIKNQISQFIEKELKLILDQEKTLITKLQKGINFLGFSLISWKPRQLKILKTTRSHTGPNGEKIFRREKRRTTSKKISILPCTERIRRNLLIRGFLDPVKQKGKHMSAWIVLDEYEIVMKYKRIINGLHNYYCHCDNISSLSFAIYVLNYSSKLWLTRES